MQRSPIRQRDVGRVGNDDVRKAAGEGFEQIGLKELNVGAELGGVASGQRAGLERQIRGDDRVRELQRECDGDNARACTNVNQDPRAGLSLRMVSTSSSVSGRGISTWRETVNSRP